MPLEAPVTIATFSDSLLIAHHCSHPTDRIAANAKVVSSRLSPLSIPSVWRYERFGWRGQRVPPTDSDMEIPKSTVVMLSVP